MKTVILTLFWLVFFFWLIRSMGVFRHSGIRTRNMYIFFTVKLLCGFLLYLVYSHYYPYRNTSDAFKYFDDSQVIYKTLYSEPSSYFKLVTGIRGDDPALDKYYSEMETWFRDKTYSTFNDNRTVVRINAITSVFSGGVYYVHILFFCFMAFAGLVMLYRFISGFSKEHQNWTTLILFFAPSLLFWSSGVLKEAVLIFSLGGFLYKLSLFIEERKWKHFLYVVVFLSLLLVLKTMWSFR